MERIQEAIEKARRERQGNIGQDGLAAEGVSPASAQQSTDLDASSQQGGSNVKTVEGAVAGSQEVDKHLASPASEDGSSIRVNYSQTKTLALDEFRLKDKLIVAGFAHDQRSEPYRQLRSQILRKFRDNSWQTLAITSPNRGSGRTLTAVNLAVSLSLETNQTVLLVDLDLKDPGVARTFGVEPVEYGIVDYVRGEKPLESILINPGYERLVMLPGTPQGAFSSEILSSPEMKAVKEELVARYPTRIIIFDLPAVLDHDDALVFAPLCDATLMVIEEGGTKKHDLERAYQLMDGSNIIGSVLNKVRYL